MYHRELYLMLGSLSDCSEAAASPVAQWAWPPPELAAPCELPLQQPDGGSRHGAASEHSAPPAAVPADWHAPATQAALQAALQAAALPPVLDLPATSSTGSASRFEVLARSCAQPFQISLYLSQVGMFLVWHRALSN